MILGIKSKATAFRNLFFCGIYDVKCLDAVIAIVFGKFLHWGNLSEPKPAQIIDMIGQHGIWCQSLNYVSNLVSESGVKALIHNSSFDTDSYLDTDSYRSKPVSGKTRFCFAKELYTLLRLGVDSN